MRDEIVLGEITHLYGRGRVDKVLLWEGYGVVMPNMATTNGNAFLAAYLVAGRVHQGDIEWRPCPYVPPSKHASATNFFLAVRHYLDAFRRSEETGEPAPRMPWS